MNKNFDPYVYEPDPENPRYLNFVRMATVGELYDFCRAALDKAAILEKFEYFDLMLEVDRDDPLPENLWRLVVFPVTGGSEGHYLHIDAFELGSGHKDLIIGKDLSTSMDTVLAAVNVLAPLIS
jgi:hypothetical protein